MAKKENIAVLTGYRRLIMTYLLTLHHFLMRFLHFGFLRGVPVPQETLGTCVTRVCVRQVLPKKYRENSLYFVSVDSWGATATTAMVMKR